MVKWQSLGREKTSPVWLDFISFQARHFQVHLFLVLNKKHKILVQLLLIELMQTVSDASGATYVRDSVSQGLMGV